ncbi:thy-1 membrane glycoprotein [Tachysurus fulvidraco]|uniref:thy-1 membrane glycoprotein n=1 Tax=Tachysurus fulvidraco TaxID=1234273 RepID=UPI001FEE10C2|nr:thy-1 membrane glycoprotein [Tachysurus fulvidraco]XP_047664928.1 thy-1 membrane glycoprotein [Tachysurus fulvidraco]
MMYYSILATFCLLGMASSQKIDGVTACLTKEQNLLLNCTYTATASMNPSCFFTIDKKTVATTNDSIVVDPTYKIRATASLINNNVCQMTLKGYSGDQPQTYNCNLYQGSTNATVAKTVEKKTTKPCSDGNVLKHGGVILLLAIVFPLLSGML